MSEARNNGGPAFPAQHFDLTESEHGLSMRDYFAAKAMQGLMASDLVPAITKDAAEHGFQRLDGIASFAYSLADAMLKARNE